MKRRRLDRDAVAQCTRVEPDLDLTRSLGAERRIADLRDGDARLAFVARDRIPRAHGVERTRCLPRLADRRSQLERRQHICRPEAFLREHVGRTELWISLKPKARSERRVAVDAETASQEQSVAPSHE